jgi:hypothetical protein
VCIIISPRLTVTLGTSYLTTSFLCLALWNTEEEKKQGKRQRGEEVEQGSNERPILQGETVNVTGLEGS